MEIAKEVAEKMIQKRNSFKFNGTTNAARSFQDHTKVAASLEKEFKEKDLD